MKKMLITMAALAMLSASAPADPVITALTEEGLSWTNDVADGYYSLEWSAGPEWEWSGSWSNLARSGGSSNLTFDINLPQVWRVVWSSNDLGGCDAIAAASTNEVQILVDLGPGQTVIANETPGAFYAVDFAVGTNWLRSLSDLCSMPATGLSMSASIPRTYRLMLLDTNVALRDLEGMSRAYMWFVRVGAPGSQSLILSREKFMMDKTEITIEHWNSVAGWGLTNGYEDLFLLDGPSQYPASRVSWYDAVKWCNARSERAGQAPAYSVGTNVYRAGLAVPEWSGTAGYRLPTEVEWEAAARGQDMEGSKFFPWGGTNALDISGSAANYRDSGDASEYLLDALCPVGGWSAPPVILGAGEFPAVPDEAYLAVLAARAKEYPPNDYGLYDMAGNVSEWCWDGYGHGSWPPETHLHRGSTNATRRVHRGGSAWLPGYKCTVFMRFFERPDKRRHNIGFRCVAKFRYEE